MDLRRSWSSSRDFEPFGGDGCCRGGGNSIEEDEDEDPPASESVVRWRSSLS